MFDLNAVTAGVTGANDTKYALIPAGEYMAQIEKYEGRQMPTSKGIATVVDITWVILDEEVKKITQLDKPTVRQSVFLELTDDQKLDTGAQKNIKLGRLREALSLNDPSKEFAFDTLLGQMALITVAHNPDKKDPEIVYANVSKVGAT